jgi:hypothetical protein
MVSGSGRRHTLARPSATQQPASRRRATLARGRADPSAGRRNPQPTHANPLTPRRATPLGDVRCRIYDPCTS